MRTAAQKKADEIYRQKRKAKVINFEMHLTVHAKLKKLAGKSGMNNFLNELLEEKIINNSDKKQV